MPIKLEADVTSESRTLQNQQKELAAEPDDIKKSAIALRHIDETQKLKEDRQTHRSALSDLDILASTIISCIWSGTESQKPQRQEDVNLGTVAVVFDKNRKLYIAGNGLSLEDKIYKTATEQFDTLSEQEKSRLYISTQTVVDVKGTNQTQKKQNPKITFTTVTKNGIQQHIRTEYRPRYKNNEIIFLTKNAIKEITQSIFDTDVNTDLRFPLDCVWIGSPIDFEHHAEIKLSEYIKMNSALFDAPVTLGVSKPCCQRCAAHLKANGVNYSVESPTDPINWTVPPQSTLNESIIWKQ